MIGWPPPAYCGPYLLTQWTDVARHADPCDCDEDNEGVGRRCTENSEWQYAVCTVDGEWTPLFAKLPRHPDPASAPELLRELTALSRQVVDTAKRCVERRLASRAPCEARVRRARAEVLEEAYDELHAAVSALWEAEDEAEGE